jgi:hypothetical protein
MHNNLRPSRLPLTQLISSSPMRTTAVPFMLPCMAIEAAA